MIPKLGGFIAFGQSLSRCSRQQCTVASEVPVRLVCTIDHLRVVDFFKKFRNCLGLNLSKPGVSYIGQKGPDEVDAFQFGES